MGVASDIKQQAVIYCRVSGLKQVREGDGLHSQETRCREYATYKGYEVAQVFTDDMTGSSTARPGMQSMLGYLHMNANAAAKIVVIIDDISRLARGLTAHLELRQSLLHAGGKLESPSIEFAEDSDSVLVENLLASVAQHQREKNGEQTRNRMKGRLLNGYFVFQAPVGYRYEKRAGRGKMLVRDEPLASIIQEALEGYAAGRFASQAEMTRFLESCPAYPKCFPSGHIRQQRVSELISRVLYAGYIEHAPWGVSRRKGQHEPIISLETYQRNQERSNARAVAPMRKDLNQDFPLRGALACSECGHTMTGCWSTSSTGRRYPYYLCQTKGCERYRKSHNRDKVEAAFEDILQRLQPSRDLTTMITAMFKDVWAQRQGQTNAAKAEIDRRMNDVDKQIASLLDRIVVSDNATVIAAYEKRITELENNKLVLAEKRETKVKPKHTREEIIELGMNFLSNPWNIWKSGSLQLKRMVLRLAFAGPLAYDAKNGFRTPQVAVPFEFLGLNKPKCKMVRSRRLELPRELPHSDLNAARLPIPPRPHCL